MRGELVCIDGKCFSIILKLAALASIIMPDEDGKRTCLTRHDTEYEIDIGLLRWSFEVTVGIAGAVLICRCRFARTFKKSRLLDHDLSRSARKANREMAIR